MNNLEFLESAFDRESLECAENFNAVFSRVKELLFAKSSAEAEEARSKLFQMLLKPAVHRGSFRIASETLYNAALPTVICCCVLLKNATPPGFDAAICLMSQLVSVEGHGADFLILRNNCLNECYKISHLLLGNLDSSNSAQTRAELPKFLFLLFNEYEDINSLRLLYLKTKLMLLEETDPEVTRTLTDLFV
jgi:hypothetical protein